MYRCSKCQEEYDERVEVCVVCGSKIEEEDLVKEDEPIEYDREVLLINAADEVQASMIETMLADYNIPVMKKRKEAGSYLNIYMGMNFCGIELYVPSELYESAKELIKEIEEIEEQEKETPELDEEMEIEKNLYYKKRLIKARIILLFFVPGLLWIIIAVVKELISLLR